MMYCRLQNYFLGETIMHHNSDRSYNPSSHACQAPFSKYFLPGGADAVFLSNREENGFASGAHSCRAIAPVSFLVDSDLSAPTFSITSATTSSSSSHSSTV
mmetsp:Transcript_37517/g.67564  ORF Transcript_37517/g.67564 Transcript_37517/m.67564 type:complete len:101 (-) Transcript_37517:1253-1555(-)